MATQKVQLLDDVTGDMLYPETSPDMVKFQNNKTLQQLLAAGFLWAGVAHTNDAAVTPDTSVFYIASEVGTYTYKGGIQVTADDGVCAIKWNGSVWSKEVLGIASKEEVSQLGQEVDTEISTYIFKGKGDTAIEKPVLLTPGHSYDFYFNNDVTYTTETQNKKLIVRKENGGSSSNVVSVAAAEVIQPKYSIIAQQNDEYKIVVRADVGQSTFVRIIDTTNVESLATHVDSLKQLFQDILYNWRFECDGDNGVVKKIYLIPGHTYQISIKNDVTYTTTTSNNKLVIRKYVGSSYTNIVTIPKTGNIAGDYNIVAEQSDYYTITMRGDVDQSTFVEVVDITELNKKFGLVKKVFGTSAIFQATPDGYYKGLFGINTSGDTVDITTGGSQNFYTWVIPVEPGSLIKISGQGGDTYGRYAFITSQGVVVRKTNSTDIVSNEVLIAESGEDYLVVNLRKTLPFDCVMATGTPSDSKEMIILTTNCGHFMFGDGVTSLDTYQQNWRKMLNEAKFDVWGVEEWDKYFDYGVETIDAKDAVLSNTIQGVLPSDMTGRHTGIFYRGSGYKIESVNESLVHISKDINGKKVHFFTAYFQPGGQQEYIDIRQATAQSIINTIQTNHIQYAVIMGDLNAWYASEYDIWKNAGYKVANCGYLGKFDTLIRIPPDERPNIPADNIIVTPSINIVKTEILDAFSLNTDHVPLKATIQILF